MCACGGVNCPHCNPNLWAHPVTLGQATLKALTDRIAELEAENARLREAQRWIPVEERLPECDMCRGDPEVLESEDVLVCVGENPPYACVAEYESGGYWWSSGNDRIFRVTHWMPLPQLPALLAI